MRLRFSLQLRLRLRLRSILEKKIVVCKPQLQPQQYKLDNFQTETLTASKTATNNRNESKLASPHEKALP